MTVRRERDDWLWLAAFALAHVAIFAGLFQGVYTTRYSDTGLFHHDASLLLDGLLPYRDYVVEYPPLALVVFTLPRLVGASFRWYYVWYQVEVVVADLVVVGALFTAATRWRLPVWRVLAVYTLAVLAVGPIILQEFDIFPAALSLLAIVWLAAGRDIGAWTFLGLGVMTKVYPVLLAPIFAVLEWRQHGFHRLWRGAAAFTLACVVPLLPWLIRAPGSLATLVRYHARRGIQLESIYSSIALATRPLAMRRAEVVYSFGSWNLQGHVPGALAKVSTLVLVLVLAVVYVVIARQAWRQPEAARDIRFVGHAAALVLLAAMAASKVLSPQYLIWVVPFFPFVSGPRRGVLWAGFTVLGAVTYYIFPLHYEELIAGQLGAMLALDLRNALLIVLAVLLGMSLRVPGTRAVASGTVPELPSFA